MKVAGKWRCVYRAVDQFGQVIDVFVAPHRDVQAARRFFNRAIGTTKMTPVEVVTDQAATYPIGWRSCSRHHGTAPIATPTTVLRRIMAG